jgi:Helix-turn-helix domain
LDSSLDRRQRDESVATQGQGIDTRPRPISTVCVVSHRQLRLFRELDKQRLRLTSAESNVLWFLADAASDGGQSWPSHEYIATGTNLSKPHVKRQLYSLRDKGLVKWRQRTPKLGQRFKDSNLYTLRIGAAVRAQRKAASDLPLPETWDRPLPDMGSPVATTRDHRRSMLVWSRPTVVEITADEAKRIIADCDGPPSVPMVRCTARTA